MLIKQKDLFWGMNPDFVKRANDEAVKMSCKDGESLFEIGDKAGTFYVLLRGRVSLCREGDKKVQHTAQEPGEIVGWSALIRRDAYAAAAICDGNVELLKFDRDKFFARMSETPDDKGAFFENIATMLGNRILDLEPFLA
ncbi:MAG: cyclic nucleotide-binding domain-containing protein [Deltaproteobacteria bacterium]|nr:cyclic nucleotide-binding domain-containing protein [Deltaproteobacteria bacterium]